MSKRKLTPVGLRQVTVDDKFWEPRMKVNREVTLPIEHEQCKKTGRLDAWKLDWKEGKKNQPHYFWDSDVAKWIEAAGYSLAVHPDSVLEKKVDKVIDLMAAAQQPDGYLNLYFTCVEPDKRWTNLRDLHELYCAGHLMEAAVAYHDGTGKRKLLDVMCRYADYIDKVFGPGKNQMKGYPGHEEIELALVKLYHATGEERYVQLAKFFIEQRGQQPHYYDLEAKKRGEKLGDRKRTYDNIQAHLPVREQTTAEGHAVRACYLYAGMADVAAETGDKSLFRACKAIWKNITTKRMFIHGGVGSRRFGERFTFDYDLPNEDVYAETCAAIALVFFAHRMLHADPDAQYADIMERCLYNGTISGVSLDGKRFYYDNFLASIPPTQKFSGQKSPERQEWFGCACCPPNIARMIAAMPTYIYSIGKKELFVHLYVQGQAQMSVAGTDVTVIQKTGYPWKERVVLSVRPSKPTNFTLALRVPGWCRGAKLKVNGKAVREASIVKKGYLRIKREWAKGDRVELVLPMPVERMTAHPAVRHDQGKVALQRGPVVYCLEQVDNGPLLNAIKLPESARLTPKWEPDLLGGVVTISGSARRADPADWKDQLYRPAGRSMSKGVKLKAVPYAVWANRGLGEMITWLHRE